MTFPTVRDATVDGANRTTGDVSCTMPTHASGDLLLALITQNTDWIDWTAGPPSGSWTEVYKGFFGGTSGAWVFAKAASSASETLTLPRPNSAALTYIIYAIQGWGGTVSTDLTKTTGSTDSSNSPDPPSHTSGFGSVDTLWIAATISSSDSYYATSFPSNYTDNQQQRVVGGSQCFIAAATRNYNSASDDPGAFGLTGTVTSIPITLSVKPAAAASTPIPLFMAHYS